MPRALVSYVTAYHVVDCPDHPQSALVLASGTFCFHCGREVHADVLGSGPVTTDAPETLKAEARTAWNDSQTIRAFAAGMQTARGASPIRRAS